jgi:hypothetical protein
MRVTLISIVAIGTLTACASSSEPPSVPETLDSRLSVSRVEASSDGRQLHLPADDN